MPSLIDDDVDHRARAQQQYPVSEPVRTYLQQTGSRFVGLPDGSREPTLPVTAEDLWDYLGDFA